MLAAVEECVERLRGQGADPDQRAEDCAAPSEVLGCHKHKIVQEAEDDERREAAKCRLRDLAQEALLRGLGTVGLSRILGRGGELRLSSRPRRGARRRLASGVVPRLRLWTGSRSLGDSSGLLGRRGLISLRSRRRLALVSCLGTACAIASCGVA